MWLEQPVLLYICRLMPAWVSPDILTTVGFAGSIMVALGFIVAKVNVAYLFISVAGFFVQWFGDSLDGRLAYYRHTPRKWYGFALDVCVDWVSIALITFGLFYFLPSAYRFLAFTLMITYGWSMMMALLKFKITNQYAIDIGYFGPTELRIAICMGLLIEIMWPGSLMVFAIIVNVLLVFINLKDFYWLLQAGNLRDKLEKNKAALED